MLSSHCSSPDLSYLAFSTIHLCRGVSVGVVYAGNKVVLKSGPMTDLNSVWMVRSLSNLDDDSARPVPYLKVVP